MTDNENNSSSAPRRRSETLWLVLAILIAAGLFAAAYLLPVHGALLPMAGGDLQQKMMDMERRVHTLEDRANAADARFDGLSSGEQSPVRPLSPTDLEHIQNDMAQMSSTINNLQDQMKQNSGANLNRAQTLLAKMIAFVQLRDAAASNRGFAHELDVMRAAAKDDASLKDPLDKLAPYSEKGAPAMAMLREQLAGQSGATDVAITKAAAQNWWERILAEFHGLVQIHAIGSGGSDNAGIEPIKAAMAHDDISGALAALKNLPPEAQQILADWQKQAEARLAINAAIAAMADRLAASSDSVPATVPATAPPSTPDKDAP